MSNVSGVESVEAVTGPEPDAVRTDREDSEVEAEAEKVSYPSEQQEMAVRIVECVRDLTALACPENAGAVFSAADQLVREAHEARLNGFNDEAIFVEQAAALVRASVRIEEEPALGLEPPGEDEEPEDEGLDEEILEPEEQPAPVTQG